MLYQINIVDTKGKPVSGARLFVRVGYLGQILRQINVPASGTVVLDTNIDGDVFQPGIMVIAVRDGYADTGAPANALAENNDFVMEKRGNLLVPIAIGAGALLLMSRKGKKVKGFFDNMPPMAKNALVIGGVGIAAYYLIFKGKGPNTDFPDLAAKELAALAARGIYPTFNEAQAAAMSGTIVSAVDDCGTDEGAIWQVMQQIQNKADILLLAKQYGIREYKGCFDGDYFDFHERNLAETLTSELSSGWIHDINELFRSKGIDFKF